MTSLGKNQAVVQDSENFAELASELSKSTRVIHVSKEKVDAYRESSPFWNSLPVHGISKMLVIMSDGTNAYLWANSSYH